MHFGGIPLTAERITVCRGLDRNRETWRDYPDGRQMMESCRGTDRLMRDAGSKKLSSSFPQTDM